MRLLNNGDSNRPNVGSNLFCSGFFTKMKRIIGLIILNFIFIFVILTFWMPYYCAYKMSAKSPQGGNNSDAIETIEAPIIVAGMPSFKGPQIYRDSNSRTVFYVESDGRHITAISAEGKLLWHRDPFVDGKLEPYRSSRPVIVYIGEENNQRAKDYLTKENAGSGSYLRILFDSTQFGALDTTNGNFYFGGQD